MNELDFAKKIAIGDLPSPAMFEGAAQYFSVRISGTGIARRETIKECVFRDPEIWLSQEMQRRVLGLPVVWNHPHSGLLTATSFRETVVGIVVHSYVKGDELWGIARIFIERAASELAAGKLDTSPGVFFAKVRTLANPSGEVTAFEGDPSLIDHLALCAKGVWSLGSEPDGVEITPPNGPPSSNPNKEL